MALKERPTWPYEPWSTGYDIAVYSIDRTGSNYTDAVEVAKPKKTYTESSDEQDEYEPDHWFDGLDLDVSENCPINTLLKTFACWTSAKPKKQKK